MDIPTKILIDGPAWIGDMIMAQTLFKLLKQRDPTCQIDVLAPVWTKPLLERMPEVSESVILPFKHKEFRIVERYQIAKSLREKNYKWALVLRNSFKSALIPYWANIPKRTGWIGECRFGLLNDWRKLDEARYPLMIERFMALALEPRAELPKHPALPKLIVSAESVQRTLANKQLNKPNQPVLALCPGAEFGVAKRWPLEYFAEVAKAKLKQGWAVWLFGSGKDKIITDAINVLCDHRCVNLAGKTELTEAIDLLSLTSMVVTNDSGLMHVSAALDRPLIVLYGSSSPKFTPPLAHRIKILSLNLSCSPCFKRECPLVHMNCLKNLAPASVLAAIAELMDEQPKVRVEEMV